MKVYRVMSYKEFEDFMSGKEIIGRNNPSFMSTSSGVCFMPARTILIPISKEEDFDAENKATTYNHMMINKNNEDYSIINPIEYLKLIGDSINQVPDIFVEFEIDDNLLTAGFGWYSNEQQCIFAYEESFSIAPSYHRIAALEYAMSSYSNENAVACKATCFEQILVQGIDGKSRGGKVTAWFDIGDYEIYKEGGIDAVKQYIWNDYEDSLVEYEPNMDPDINAEKFSFESEAYGDYEHDMDAFYTEDEYEHSWVDGEEYCEESAYNEYEDENLEEDEYEDQEEEYCI